MSLLDDIANHLVSNNIVGGATGWDIYKSYLPDDADQAVSIHDTGGDDPDQTDGTKYDQPTFQVRIRGLKMGYAAAFTKAEAVFNSLNNATISGYVYIFAAHSGVLPLGYDQNYRPMLSINFNTMKQR